MKTRLVLTLFLFGSPAIACPNLEGTYKNNKIPGNEIEISQRNCDSIVFKTTFPPLPGFGGKPTVTIQDVQMNVSVDTLDVTGKIVWDGDRYVADMDMSRSHHGKLKIEYFRRGEFLVRRTTIGNQSVGAMEDVYSVEGHSGAFFKKPKRIL